ncbi:TlpA disulfide reductase family protein [Aliiglaciecola sp. CAU 1673]|uniref:TlpA family protein disulfide reductase n=1 Tax=Aliiglaciecola sp. CAU 1673 TaxID=3032595 RepID=UPI0023DC6077|nr:TlpA disulfide reductase family protein [Aliiglaciecola sp. CAU 1673]MDF2177861.1 TlpA disulfide reductase family protein [Aliiglaciecola sp. CAU 1673]
MKFRPLHDFSALAIVVVVLTGLTAFTAKAADSKATTAPDFTLKSRDGGNLRLAEQRGNIVLVNFWASWCGPCREELPKFEEMYQRYQDLGFVVLGVNVDDDPAKAEILLSDISISFPVLFDPKGEVSRLYDISAMPTTILIDRDGNTRLVHKGYKSGDEVKYEKALKLLLRE